MIGSFLLSLVLFAIASLVWGFVFSSDIGRLGKRLLLSLVLLSSIISIFTSVFFLKGMASAGSDLELVTSSLVFAATFVLALISGFGLGGYSKTSKLFSYVEKMLRSEDKSKKDHRSELIDEILDRTTETGKIDILERELIGSILKFKDKIVREVMIPRGDVVAIDINEEPRRILRKVIEEGYSRLPVYRGSIDNIVGIIYAKDLLTMVEDGAAIVLQDLLRMPYYVPESKAISQLLREMQRNKVHLAVVVDEFGGTEGIVTLEDVLEEIVGEIQDEYDEVLPELIRDENGDVHFSGSMTVERFNELLESNIPQEDDYDTMAGFVQKLAGKLPQKDEVYNYEEMFFNVEEVARHRIKRLRVSFKEHPSLAGSLAETAPSPKSGEEIVESAVQVGTSSSLGVKQPKPESARKPRSNGMPSKKKRAGQKGRTNLTKTGRLHRKDSLRRRPGNSRKAENKKR